MNISNELINNLKMQVQRVESDFITKVLERNDDVTKNQIRKEMWRFIAIQNGLTITSNKEDHPVRKEINIHALVEKFLAWELPTSVSSDSCVTAPQPSDAVLRRTGTNLLTATEVEQMLRYLFDM